MGDPTIVFRRLVLLFLRPLRAFFANFAVKLFAELRESQGLNRRIRKENPQRVALEQISQVGFREIENFFASPLSIALTR